MSTATLDLIFPVRGKTLAWDHSYALYGALCRRQPLLHDPDHPIGIFPINGLAQGQRTLNLTEKSALRLRLPADRVGDVMPLFGAELDLDGHKIRLDSPRLEPVTQAARLFSAWVTYAGATDEAAFLSCLRDDLSRREIDANAQLVQPLHAQSKDGGKGSRDHRLRRTRSVKGKNIVGYALLVEGLSSDDSARICAQGLGGRRHFGGGLFLPARNRP